MNTDTKCPRCYGKGWIFKGHGEDEQCDCTLIDPPEPTTEQRIAALEEQVAAIRGFLNI